MQKTKFSGVVSTFILCFAFWMLLTWSVDTQELIAGAIVSLAAALFTSRFFIHESPGHFYNPFNLLEFIIYLGVFDVELFKANIDMAKRCLGGYKNINPGIIKTEVDLPSDYAESLLANCITLTPGTITLDIAEQDGKTYFYVHCIDVTGMKELEPGVYDPGDAFKGNMEKWIRRVWH